MAELDAENVRVEREGLPPTYRMRADAHYVDQLSARSADIPMRLIATDDIDAEDSGDSLDGESIRPLAQSILTLGMLQPLLVRREGSRYRLIAGQKRLAAARSVDVTRVPCLVYTADDAQAEALARAADLRADGELPWGPPEGRHVPRANPILKEVSDAVATIQSALGLIADDGSPVVRRIAFDLLRAAAWNASWQMRAQAILDETYRWRMQSRLLGTALTRVRDGFAADGRLRVVDVRLQVDDWNVAADVDEDALVAGICGAATAMAALAESPESPQVVVTMSSTDRGASIDLTQEAAVADADAAARVFEASLGARVARAVARHHGGDATFTVGWPRGSTLSLTLGRGSMASPANTRRSPHA